MTLPLDVSRCAGRFGPSPGDPVCPRRQQCARYLAMLGPDRERFHDGYPGFVLLHDGLCKDGDDNIIEVSE